jgi:Family of unknown function (DUF6445)
MELHPYITLNVLTVGAERAPLLVIDNVTDADALVAIAATAPFTATARYYPGIRAPAPQEYQQFVASRLATTFAKYFQLEGTSLRFTMCHFSLVTTRPEQLSTPQRIPHVDSLGKAGLATIHYLFRKNLGGTAFYRHRATGFESVDESRQAVYLKALERETAGPDGPGAEYINGDTALFEQIARQDGVYNRMLVYRRNSLHSGCIGKDFVPDSNPLTGRLSINSFIDLGP